jgi:Zn-dependent protease with chaperone function
MIDNQSYTQKYRKQAVKAVISILAFILIYIILLVLSLVLICLFVYFGLKIISVIENLFVIVFGLILLVTGLLLLIFTLRFYFRKYSVDRSGWIEITKNEQPRLFELIESVAVEIQTNMPQRVFLSPFTEAMVFYDSNFWNLFFPSKENLVIGLGLVNSVNESELKSILAHEFGHFLQRSMKIYTYVYIENQIIYKMLIDGNFYNSILAKFSKTVGPFFWVIIGYASFIRWILRIAYETIYTNFMALSREMEFHADEIAAQVAGSEPAITSLQRISLAESTFNNLGEFYYNLVSENLKTDNVYSQHYHSMMTLATKYGAEIKNDLPQITHVFFSRFSRSKLVITDQWASHPTIDDRIKRLKELNIDAAHSTELAWVLFGDKEELQKKLTEKLFQYWQYPETPEILDLEGFKIRFQEQIDKYAFDEKYNHFYDLRDISVFKIAHPSEYEADLRFINFEDIYTDDNVELVQEYSGLYDDIKTLESIDRKEIRIESFEYDGVKYHRNDSNDLLNELIEKHKEKFNEINELDIQIFNFFRKKAKLINEEEELIRIYEDYFFVINEDKENLKLYLDMIEAIQFISRFLSFGTIERYMTELKEKEKLFKEKVNQLINDERYNSFIEANNMEKLKEYASKEWVYFEEPNYDDEAISVLEETLYLFSYIYSRAPGLSLKVLLDYQLKLLTH